MILVRRLYSRHRYKYDDGANLKMIVCRRRLCLLKRVFRSVCGSESLAKVSHIRHILTYLVLCINQRATKNISNQVVGTRNKKCSYLASSFLLFILLRFSPSSGLDFLDLLPPAFSVPCRLLLVVENTSYINVPGTQNFNFPSEHRFLYLMLMGPCIIFIVE